MRPYQLTLGDEAAIRNLPEVRAATAELSRSDLYEVSQWGNTSGHVMGVTPNYTTVRFIPIAAGRFLDDDDLAEKRRVAVLGFKAANLLFNGRPMLGETITINGIAFTVVGSVDKISRGNNDFDDEKIYIPVTTMQQLFPLKGDNIPAGCADLDPISTDHQERQRPPPLPRSIASSPQRHGFDPSLNDAFDECDTITEMKMIGVIFTAMDVFLGASAL